MSSTIFDRTHIRVTKSVLAILCVAIMIFVSTIDSHAEIKSSRATVFIGDSRTVGMNNVIHMDKHDDTFVIAKSGMGYKWLVDSAIPELEKLQKENQYDEWTIVFNLGVNDLKRVDDYVEIIPTLEKYGTLYYVSINPTVDSVGGIQCKSIEKFNNKIIPEVDRYIDSYTFLKNVGYYAKDGMHYDSETYERVYGYICLNLSIWNYLSANNQEEVQQWEVNQMLQRF